jgi:RNA-directed DNA polymerase
LKRAENLVTDPTAVARHAFYPLISYEITSKKLTKAPNSHKLVAKGKIRPISYAAHLDSHIYSYYAHLLSIRYEAFLTKNDLTDSILAFRQLGKNNINFAADAFSEIRRRGNCAAVALDISGFFDNLDHELLKQSWCSLLDVTRLPQDHFAVFRSITKYSRVDRSKLYRALNISTHNPRSGRYRVCTASQFRDVVRRQGLITQNPATFGIPQGTPISAILSNIYMMGFDLAMQQRIHHIGGLYYRYCDDILLIVPH